MIISILNNTGILWDISIIWIVKVAMFTKKTHMKVIKIIYWVSIIIVTCTQ